MSNIINIYNALVECQIKPDLSSDIHVACVTMGWPSAIQEFVVPRGATMTAWQTAIALTVSSAARQNLVGMESMRNFDLIINEAQERWVQLNKSNKVSRILTDYLKA